MSNFRFRFVFFKIWIALVFYSSACSQNNETTDQRVINFQATDLQGRPFHGTSLKGQIILLDFWAVWCRPCIAAFPALKKMNDDFKDNGFQVIGIASYSGTVEDVRQFVKKHDLDYPVVVGDRRVIEKFRVIGYPTYFLIDPDGNVYKKYVGETEGLYEKIKTAVLELRIRHGRKEE